MMEKDTNIDVNQVYLLKLKRHPFTSSTSSSCETIPIKITEAAKRRQRGDGNEDNKNKGSQSLPTTIVIWKNQLCLRLHRRRRHPPLYLHPSVINPTAEASAKRMGKMTMTLDELCQQQGLRIQSNPQQLQHMSVRTLSHTPAMNQHPTSATSDNDEHHQQASSLPTPPLVPTSTIEIPSTFSTYTTTPRYSQ